MTRIALLSILLLLAACNSMSLPGWPKPAPEAAASASAWAKPGADAATVEGAYGDCVAATDTATKTDFDIDQDIAASRSSDLQHSDFARSPMRQAQDTSRDRAQAVLSSCMEAKGFSPAR
ncbi:MAG TPA: hypothetical protein VN808_05545 [Stellaceae bacterium]|nr:hypothetical protein [Stellaceae bacterium]